MAEARYEKLMDLAQKKHWPELEHSWLTTIGEADLEPHPLIPVIQLVVEGGRDELAQTMGWALLTVIKKGSHPAKSLQLARELVAGLKDGDELREEILGIYRASHPGREDLESWIERSGLKSGKSVRRSLRFLDIGLSLFEGAYLVHRTDDEAAKVVALDPQADEVTVLTSRRTETHTLGELISDYDVADEHDFRVLSQLMPERLAELVEKNPAQLAEGIVRAQSNRRIDRDELKLLLVPKHVEGGKWSDWWSRLRNGVKKNKHLTIEGRSPMFLIYHEAGKSPEEEAEEAFAKAESPKAWLDLIETYLRDAAGHGRAPDAGFLDRMQADLAKRIDRFEKHRDPSSALATALVVERLAMDGLPISTDAHGRAVRMLQEAKNPVAIVGEVVEARLWPLAVRCVQQAFPDRPEYLAELILHGTASQCDGLAKQMEEMGRGDLLGPIVERALADPGRYTEATMWIWNAPGVKAALPIPPRMELLNLILTLVGPARSSDGKTSGQSVNEMRATVRSGLSGRNFEQFKKCLEGMDPGMARALSQLIVRAEGLGPRTQDDMLGILRGKFARLYEQPKVALWDDDTVVYFTHAGLKTKEAELDDLVNVKMRENAKAIGEAASHGDLSENSEYKFALEERDLLRARVAQMNKELSIAKLVDPAGVPEDHISIGQRVTLRLSSGGDPLVVTIMGAGDSDVARRVFSYQTPMAKSVLGRKVGETVPVSLEGHEAQYLVERIERALE